MFTQTKTAFVAFELGYRMYVSPFMHVRHMTNLFASQLENSALNVSCSQKLLRNTLL